MSGDDTSRVVRTAISRWAEPVCGFLGLVLLGALVVFIAKGWVPRERWHPGPDDIGVLAVMPFDPIGDERTATFDPQALATALAAEFSSLVAVVPVERSMTHAGSQKTLRDIARELEADSILVGSIIATDDLPRVRARLVEAETSRELAAVRAIGADVSEVAAELRASVFGDAAEVAETPTAEQADSSGES